MKKRKIILITVIIVFLAALIGIGYSIFTKEDEDSTLNLLEKQWIENNKNEMIDFGLVNNIAILNSSTDSIIFEFLEKLESATGLDFNEVSYEYGEEIKEDYSFKIVDKVSKNDILVYSDNYVLVGKTKTKYNDLNEINSVTIGVSSNDLENVSKYLDNSSIKYSSIDSEYIDILVSFKENSNYDYIVMPKLLFLSQYEENDELYINYNITELTDNYVISLGDINRLNNILTKYYKKWSNENYNDVYSREFTNMYYKVSNTDEQSKVKFRSKRYTYGFVENAPFDLEFNGKLYGINNSLLKNFSKLTDAEITFKKYDSIKDLRKAINKNEIDFIFDKYAEKDYDVDIYNTVSIYDEKIVIVSPSSKNITINSLNSLENYEIAVLKDSMIAESLNKKAKKVKTYNTITDLLKYDGLIAIDLATYNFYQTASLKNYKIDYTYNLKDDYTYLVRDIKNNKVFEEFLDFYITYIDENNYILEGYQSALEVSEKDYKIRNIISIISVFICLLVAFFLGSRVMPSKKKEKHRKMNNMKKEDKLKYVDMLTSLKNRNYLNDSIERWDNSEVYPQSIIIIDLNNIAYINDNYGHQEGDTVIKEAANILINNQIANSDIIRTNGNEFLIYLVGYDEKQVVAYIKKINKEFKELAHGFGAATGYSMITDGIKTIDDAVNEATLDMRNNKIES